MSRKPSRIVTKMVSKTAAETDNKCSSNVISLKHDLKKSSSYTLRELSIAHSFGVVPPTHPRAKLRERCRIFGIFGFGDLGTKKDYFFYTQIVK